MVIHIDSMGQSYYVSLTFKKTLKIDLEFSTKNFYVIYVQGGGISSFRKKVPLNNLLYKSPSLHCCRVEAVVVVIVWQE